MGTVQQYAYDGWGNLIHKAGTTIDVDVATNHLKFVEYDSRGNLTERAGETYSYDALNRQARHDAGTAHWSYLFDASNERIVKAIPPAAGSVLRRNMARIILQAMSEQPSPTCTGRFPVDMPCADPERRWIQRFAELGIWMGRSRDAFFPDLPSARDEMAAHLATARALPGGVPASGTVPGVGSYNCESGGVSLFSDVSTTHWACSYIHYLFANGVPVSCQENPRRYCPSGPMNNLDMEAFISHAWPGFGYVPPRATYTFRGAGGSILTEFLDSSVSKDYVYLGGRLVATRYPSAKAISTWKYHTTDHLGSVRLTTDSMGGLVESPKYWPWGDNAGSPGVGRLGFAGMELDLEASVPRYYDHARSLETGIGRFLTPDVLSGHVEDPQSWNRYTYARNNPLKYVDPDGKAIALAPFLVSAAETVAAVGGVALTYLIVDQAVQAFTGRSVDSAFSPMAYEFERGFAQSPLAPPDQDATAQGPAATVLERSSSGKGHSAGARPSTANDHAAGDSRRKADQRDKPGGGEKGDANRPYSPGGNRDKGPKPAPTPYPPNKGPKKAAADEPLVRRVPGDLLRY